MKQISDAPCSCGSGQTYTFCCGMRAMLAPRPCAMPHEADAPRCSGAPAGEQFALAQAIGMLAEELDGSSFQLGLDFPSWRSCPRCLAPFVTSWSVYHDTSQDSEGRTAAQLVLAHAPEKLDDVVRTWIELQAQSWVSIWRVGRREKHPHIPKLRVPKLTDIFTGVECWPDDEWDRKWAPARSAVLARVIPTDAEPVLGAVHPVPALRHSVDCILDDLFCHPELQGRRKLELKELRSLEWINHLIALWEAPIIGTGMLTDDLC
jgi:hypothetical protein